MDYLSIGVLSTMKQNTVYALPAKKCKIYTDATATFVQSTTSAFTANSAVTLVEGAYEVSAPFIKCTSGDVAVMLKA